jgi:hypothetical protein
MSKFVRRPWWVALFLLVVSLATSAAISLSHWPNPATHDEFSYLLAADTFCEGRVANPTHAKWEHFESFHVIQQPTYASKYPPGQGVLLALGQLLTGWPIAGVWLESALAAVALYWMLLGFTTPRWAMLGGVLWLTQPKFQLAWGQSYWGGTLAFLGGALVLGAAVRLCRRLRPLDAVVMAAGAVVLASTRPFEGMIFCALVGSWVAWRWFRCRSITVRGLSLQFVLPAAAVLVPGLAALMAYNAAVTGDPLTMPYVTHERAYAQCPMFLVQEPSHPAYRHSEIERFHSEWALDWYRMQSTPRGVLYTKLAMTVLIAQFFFYSPALLMGILLVRPLRWRRVTPFLVIVALAYLATLPSVWNFPHYVAPLAPLLLVAVICGLRRADVLGQRLRPWGHAGYALVACQVAVFAFVAISHARKPYAGWWDVRAAIAAQLADHPGRDLVLVRYGAKHVTTEEWVYNVADIDEADVVWARAMDPARDAELLSYFKDRKIWVLEPDSQSLRMLPPGAAVSKTSDELPSGSADESLASRQRSLAPLP